MTLDNRPGRIRLGLTIVVSTKNEGRGIERCLDALISNFEQVIVVDSQSVDSTKELAVAAGAEVVDFDWNGMYPKKKQWCLENLNFRHDWVFFVDADEIITEPLLQRLRILEAGDFNGYRAFDIPLTYVWQGRPLNHGQVVVKRALLNRKCTLFPVLPDLAAKGMGELEGHYQPLVQGRVGRLGERIVHDDPDPVADWFTRHNGYSDWEAFLRLNPAARHAVLQLRSRQGNFLERLPGKPLVIFIYNYLARSGFRDGRAGLDYAVALAFYQWQIGVKTRDDR